MKGTKGKRLLAVFMVIVMVVATMLNIPICAQAEEVSDFVTTNGTKFWYQGGEFYYGGTNCYYINFKSKKDVERLFEGAEEMGLTVLRTWGNIDAGVIQKGVTSEGKQVFQNNADGSGEKDGVYYQYFDADLGRPVVNEGEDGIQHLDYCIAQAKKHNVKLIITFTNNWQQFGGMQQYVNWAGLSSHDDFYINETIKGWYKDYVKTLLEHENVYTGVAYKDDPTIFAWELANEPRASSDQYGKNNVLYNWVAEMSAYVKSIDPNHMVAIGDEGFFNYEYNSPDVPEGVADAGNWIWHGSEGVDYEKLMSIETVDFGTPHLYIEDWNMAGNGGSEGVEATVEAWIKRHAEVSNEAGKPVILEEFGYNAQKEGKYYDSIETFFTWMYEKTEEYGYAGTNFWMLADFVEANGSETDTPYINYDGFNVYSCTLEEVKAAGITDEAILSRVKEREPARQIIIDYCQAMTAKADNNGITPGTAQVDIAASADLDITMKLQTGASFCGLTLNDKELVKGTDYKLNDDTVTFTKEFLAGLEEGLNYITFEFSQGKNPELVLDVSDSRITSAVAGLESASFDKNPKSAKNIVIPVTIYDGGELKAVKLRGEGSKRTILTKDTDYTYTTDGNTGTVTLSANYLATLIGESVVFELDYTRGSDPAITIILKNTTGLDIIDDFESYSSSEEINAAWIKNNYGSHAEGELVTDVTSSNAMKYKYSLGNYCGLTKKLSDVDISAFTGVQFWYQPDASGQNLVIQMKDDAGNYWEKRILLDSTEAVTLKIPFSEFAIKDSDAGEVLRDAIIKEFSIYAEKVGNLNNQSELYFDDIEFYAEGTDFVPVAVESVSLNKEEIHIEKGETETLNVTVLPVTATNKNVVWSSSDEEVATVVNGVVNAKKAGTAEITVKTADGNFTAVCQVIVTEMLTTTEEPTTEAVVTTQEVTTEVVTTREPVTEAATTREVTTEVATTREPVTEAATTREVTTEVATTREPVTEAATTREVTTEVATTREPVTEAATTREVTTEVATTREPVTEEVTTEAATTETKVAIETIIVDVASLDLKIGESYQLNAIISPQNASYESLLWISNDKNVVNVDTTGKITALNEGVAVITVTAVGDGKQALCIVNVTKDEAEQDIAIESITVVPEELALTVGETETLTATVKPENATNKTISWSSSNKDVAVVDSNGKVIAVSAGMAVVKAVSADGKVTGECQVTVTKIPEQTVEITGIHLNTESFEMSVGNDAVLTATVEPADAENKTVLWSTSNASVATVEEGKVTAVGAGTAIITATTSDGKFKAECTIDVREKTSEVVAVTDIAVTPAEVTLKEAEKKQLTAKIIPSDATEQTVTWTSSNSNIVTVSETGEITAVTKGSVVIIATTKDGGKTACCNVTVEGEPEKTVIPVEDVLVEPGTVEMTEGETKALTVTVLPVNADNQNIRFTTSDESVVTVDAEGNLNAVAAGKATIIVVTEDGSKTAFCNVTVKGKEQTITTVKVTAIQMDTTPVTLNLKKSKNLNVQVLPTNATNKTVTFKSSDTKVAVVDARGKVTSVAPGIAIITVQADGNITKSVTIKVKPAKVTSVKRKVYRSGKVKLSWKKQKGVTGYEVYRYNTKAKKYKLYKRTSKNYITITKLKKNTTYKFRVKAYKKSGSTVIRGNYSNVLKIK